ncbi:MAG: hypothetical protein JXR95_12770 [Deltaproteobacteria bacterium]|nr:hypothetical protein [Deltaproteobacteria bacterium]
MKNSSSTEKDPGTVEMLINILGNKHSKQKAVTDALEKTGGFPRLARMTQQQLVKSGLFNKPDAEKIVNSIKLGRKALTNQYPNNAQLISSRQVFEYLVPYISWPFVEEFWIVGLDVKQRVVNLAMVARGGISEVSVPVSSVFQHLISWGTPRGICCHTHPSGDPEPSSHDIAITDRLIEAASFLDIKIIDHIILGQGTYSSLADMGYV